MAVKMIPAMFVTPPRRARRTGLPLVREGMHTPWGAADYAQLLAPGIGTVGTPSHGGIKLSPQRNKQVPEKFRQAGGWYEEDCDWCIPFCMFEGELYMTGEKYAVKAIESGQHKQAAKNWRPDFFEQFYGVEIPEGESYIRAHPLRH